MKRTIAIILCILGLAAGALAGHRTAEVQDIVLLAQGGVSDETILTYLAAREIGFALGPKEILALRDAGVSEEVIRYLIERSEAERTANRYAAAPSRSYRPTVYYDPGYYRYYPDPYFTTGLGYPGYYGASFYSTGVGFYTSLGHHHHYDGGHHARYYSSGHHGHLGVTRDHGGSIHHAFGFAPSTHVGHGGAAHLSPVHGTVHGYGGHGVGHGATHASGFHSGASHGSGHQGHASGGHASGGHHGGSHHGGHGGRH